MFEHFYLDGKITQEQQIKLTMLFIELNKALEEAKPHSYYMWKTPSKFYDKSYYSINGDIEFNRKPVEKIIVEFEKELEKFKKETAISPTMWLGYGILNPNYFS